MLVSTMFAPLSEAEFIARYWDREPVLIPGSPARIRDFLSADFGREKLFSLLARAEEQRGFELQAFAFPATRVIEGFEHEELPSYPIGIEAARRILSGGSDAALNIVNLEGFDRGLLKFATRMRRALSLAGRTELAFFYHPPCGGGIRLHYDYGATFHLLLEGKKKWRISRHPHQRWPRSWGSTLRDGSLAIFEPGREPQLIDRERLELLEFSMEPGDLIYLPAGAWHETESAGSLGLTFAYYPVTFDEILHRALSEYFQASGGWRSAVPPSPEGASFFQDRLDEARNFLARLRGDGPELSRIRRKIEARRPPFVAAELRARPYDGRALAERDLYAWPIDAPVTWSEGRASQLSFYYGEDELIFDDPSSIACAARIASLAHETFRGTDALGERTPWPELAPVLERLVSAGFLLHLDPTTGA